MLIYQGQQLKRNEIMFEKQLKEKDNEIKRVSQTQTFYAFRVCRLEESIEVLKKA